MKKFALESIFTLTNKLLELLYAYLFFFWKTNMPYWYFILDVKMCIYPILVETIQYGNQHAQAMC
jgi:hypothetical protein